MGKNMDKVNEGIKKVDFLADKERADRIQQTKDELDPIRARLKCKWDLLQLYLFSFMMTV